MSFVHREHIICISRDLLKNFDAWDFTSNGPNIITRVMKDICSTEDRTLWTRRQCNGATVQPKEKVVPLEWADYMLYFEPKDLSKTLDIVKNSTAIHLWSDRSRNIWNKVGFHNAYQVLAEKHCPSVYFDTDFL